MAHTDRARGLRRPAAAHLAVAAAFLSAGAAAIHAGAAGPHFDHYVPFGILFVATAVLQAAWAVGVLVSPSRRLLAAGAAGNAGVVAAWALSRTAGLPAGPDAWTAEPVTLLDGAATALELAIVAASAALLRARAGQRIPLEARRLAAVGAIAVAGLAAVPLALAGGGHHHDHGSHDDEAAAHATGHVHAAEQPPQPVTSARTERARAAQSNRSVPAAKTPHDHASHAHEHP